MPWISPRNLSVISSALNRIGVIQLNRIFRVSKQLHSEASRHNWWACQNCPKTFLGMVCQKNTFCIPWANASEGRVTCTILNFFPVFNLMLKSCSTGYINRASYEGMAGICALLPGRNVSRLYFPHAVIHSLTTLLISLQANVPAVCDNWATPWHFQGLPNIQRQTDHLPHTL